MLQLSLCMCGCREPASLHRGFLVGLPLPEKMLFLWQGRGDASLFASQQQAMPGW